MGMEELSREERIRRLAERRSSGRRRRSPPAVRWFSIVVGAAATVGLTGAMARADASSPSTTTTVPATSPSTLVVVVHRPVTGSQSSGGSVTAVPAPSQASPLQAPRMTTHGSR